MNAQILSQVNTLMVRASINEHRAQRAFLTGSRREADRLATFSRAARTRARFLMAKVG